MKPFFLYPLVDQYTGFCQVYVPAMLKNIFTSYGAIEEIDLEEKSVKMIGALLPHGTSSPSDQKKLRRVENSCVR